MLITRKIEIDAGHRIPNHESKCFRFHGHRYVIECGVDDKVITEKGKSNEGMVIDFSHLKAILESEIDAKFDHKFIYYESDYEIYQFNMQEIIKKALGFVSVKFIPTAENLAKHWYELVKPRLQERGIKIKYLKVWETPNSTATYEE